MTFTVIARQQGLLGIAQCTSAVAVGGRCPFIRANVGAVCTQAHTDPGLGPLAIQLLTMGHSPEKVLKDLAETDPDFAWRQVGIVDRHGRVAGAHLLVIRNIGANAERVSPGMLDLQVCQVKFSLAPCE